MIKTTHWEIQIRLAWHYQALCLDTRERVLETTFVVGGAVGGLSNERDVPSLPGVEESKHVIGVPGTQPAAFPLSAEKVVQRGVSPVHEVSVLTEPLVHTF